MSSLPAIKNYKLHAHDSWFQEPLSFQLTRCKWLKRPIGFLLKRLGAYNISRQITYQRIEINTENLREHIYRLLQENTKNNGKDIKCFVLGYDNFSKFIKEAEPWMFCYGEQNTFEFCGKKIVLNSQINGVVPLTFAP